MKILLFIACVFIGFLSFSQSPNSFKYQAVARNADGSILANQSVNFRISILKGDTNGSSVYSEIHNATTTENGLVNFNIGKGESTDSFQSIEWNEGVFFVEVAIDVNAGSDYQVMGTSQLLSVPYALHSNTSDSIIGGINEADPIFQTSLASKISIDDTTRWGQQNGLSDELLSVIESLQKPIVTNVQLSINNEISLETPVNILTKLSASDTIYANYDFISPVQLTDQSTISWFVDDVLTITDQIAFLGEFVKNDEVYFSITPDDGVRTGKTIYSDTITVQNSPPQIEGNLEIIAFADNDSLRIEYNYFDADGDDDQSTFRWFTIGESENDIGSTQAIYIRDILNGIPFDSEGVRSAEFCVEVILSDGDQSGTPFVSQFNSCISITEMN